VHEFSVCQNLLQQVEALAHTHRAQAVNRIRLQIGPLSGIEAALLTQAFTVACAGTVAAGAVLETESLPVRVRCTTCGADSDATPNRLLCGVCGDWHTELLSGDEMLLASVELELEEDDV
jgi:hydrogenase nickel incorporation protein HypA/HybF